MLTLTALFLGYTMASAHHFTNTTTGQVIRHFPSTKVVRNTTMYVYFRPHDLLQAGETLVARWTPPVIDGPCRVYEYTLPAMGKIEFVTTQLWNKAALDMFCPGEWTCEIIVRTLGPPDTDEILHETAVHARRF